MSKRNLPKCWKVLEGNSPGVKRLGTKCVDLPAENLPKTTVISSTYYQPTTQDQALTVCQQWIKNGLAGGWVLRLTWSFRGDSVKPAHQSGFFCRLLYNLGGTEGLSTEPSACNTPGSLGNQCLGPEERFIQPQDTTLNGPSWRRSPCWHDVIQYFPSLQIHLME